MRAWLKAFALLSIFSLSTHSLAEVSSFELTASIGGELARSVKIIPVIEFKATKKNPFCRTYVPHYNVGLPVKVFKKHSSKVDLLSRKITEDQVVELKFDIDKSKQDFFQKDYCGFEAQSVKLLVTSGDNSIERTFYLKALNSEEKINEAIDCDLEQIERQISIEGPEREIKDMLRCGYSSELNYSTKAGLHLEMTLN